MFAINISHAKRLFSQLVARANQGEEIVIMKNGIPVAKLVCHTPQIKPRQGGQWRGRVRIDDDFDAPLPQSC